ncbi:hypothetical protein [Methanothrix sp.]|jgi:hypothetical protein|uniref:hypothetical protein n=2 Tax=Methanothrix sp. TaxID=90426 RepID=UPI003C757634
MTRREPRYGDKNTWMCFFLVCVLAAPAAGISVSCSTSAGGETVGSQESFSLNGSTSLQESLLLGSGSISAHRQSEGKGNNSLKQSLTLPGRMLQNDINSQGEFASSTTSAVSGQWASIHQNAAGTGSMNLELRGRKGDTDAGQEASVSSGSLRSSQSLSAAGGISASQSTEIGGQKGRVLSGALGKENVLLAEVGFSGEGSLSARLTSGADEKTLSQGHVAIDDTVLLDDGSFEAVSNEGEGRIMGMAGARLIGEEGQGIGGFDLKVMNLARKEKRPDRPEPASTAGAAASSGGSYSSYALTGCRWNVRDPQVQLYLNPIGTPAGISVEASKMAIASAANTWDDAVRQNLFADGETVIVDYTKVVDNPFPPRGQEVMDGYSVCGWKSLGANYLGLNRWWADGQIVDEYNSILETDVWFNSDFLWTTDLATAWSTGRIDLESVALHELGHGIGLDDLYLLPDGDPRKNDLQQVMNLYCAPQRELGNGDRAGVQKLYDNRRFSDTIGIYNPQTAMFYLNYFNQPGAADYSVNFGPTGMVPIIGDWDGDGKDNIGIYNPHTAKFYFSYFNRPGAADYSVNFGPTGMVPIIGDWDGDGKDNIGIYNPQTAMFYLSYSNQPGAADYSVNFGPTGMVPIIGDWDGDGKDNIGIYNPPVLSNF